MVKKKAAITPKRERLVIWQREQLSRWAVSAIRLAIAQHEAGDLSNSALLADHLSRNPRIFAALQTRTNAMSALPFSIEASCQANGLKEGLEAVFSSIAPEAVIAELLRSAVTCGVAVGDVVWTSIDGRWLPSIHPIHSSAIRWDATAKKLFVECVSGLVEVTKGDGRWIVLAHGATAPWMLGLVRCLGLEDKIRTEAVKDWARWSERHGAALVLGRVPANASEDDKQYFYDSLQSIGSGGTVVLAPRGETAEKSFDVDLVEAKSDGWQGFDRLLSLVASDAAIAILGQNLTQETTGGSLAAAKVHDRVRGDILRADSEVIATAIRRDVLCPWALFNYGDSTLAPWVYWDAEEPEDIAATMTSWDKAATAVVAWKNLGVDVDIDAVCAKIKLPKRVSK